MTDRAHHSTIRRRWCLSASPVTGVIMPVACLDRHFLSSPSRCYGILCLCVNILLCDAQHCLMMKTSLQQPTRPRRSKVLLWSAWLALLLVLAAASAPAVADTAQSRETDIVANAEAEWLEGATARALQRLDRGIQAHPDALKLHTLRGHILATTSRRYQEAIETYATVLKKNPRDLDVRWAQWSVLLRSGQEEQAVAALRRIAELDADNPLLPLQLARALRTLDRLEESLLWYEKAVDMVPNMSGWRLALARARFDILDGPGARDEVERVMEMATPGSPEEAAARSLMSVIYGATKERGRRFEPILTPEGSARERKEWASIRAQAWRLFEAGHYEEVEPLYRKILALNPSDYSATHELGMTLLELDRCEDAIAVFETLSTMKPSDEVYADAFFRVGQCLVNLERWADALPYFEALHEAAVEFEERTKDVPPKAGLRVLDTNKLMKWITKVKHHIPDQARPRTDASAGAGPADPTTSPSMNEEELYRRIAEAKLRPGQQLDTQGTLMGRDADFSMFRYVIPANRVMRDDRPTGTHDFIPIEPHDTFSATQKEIYLVFGLVIAAYDAMPLRTECFPETSGTPHSMERVPVAQDYVITGMGDQSGYFVLSPPETGWTPGLHRCGLFVGNEASAYTHADEVRFRIIPSPLARHDHEDKAASLQVPTPPLRDVPDRMDQA